MDYSQPQTAKPWGLYPTQGQTPLPLRSLEIRIEIIHTVARVFYTQQYFNNTNLLLETEFFFPISPDACFDSFEATFNNTTIKGVVKEKEKAKEEYKEAVEQGRTAAYSEINQETGDIMKVQIGNTPPDTNVSIKHSYILKLDTMLNKFWCFRLFSTLTPRYNSGKNNLKDVLSQDVDILSKYPTISGNNSEAYPWTIQAEIQSPSPITFLKSPSHDIIIEYGNENHTCKIALDPSSQHLPNKDFVLLYTNGKEGEKLDYLLTPFEEGYCAMVSMLADFDKDTGETAFAKFEQAKEIENQYSMNMIRGEYIMLVDRSGSMSGERINMAKESLILFLKSLPKESYFNIVSFGSSFEFLHNSSVAYSQQSLNTSVAQIETFEADMGGTEIFQPLSSVFNSPLKKGYPRFIFLLTDGDVSNTRQVLDLIMTNNDKARVFTIGIGSGCSPELITKAASYGRGRHEFVTENSQINQKVIGLLNASLSPCYSDLSLHSDNFDAVVKSVSPNPASIPFLINGQTVTFFLFLRSAAFQDSQMRLQLRLYDSRSKKNCHLDVELDLSNAMENDLLPKLAIHDMIKRLDTQKDQVGQNKAETDVVWMEKADLRQAMVDYSLKYGILCKETAFFCEVVDSEKQNVNLLPAKVIIPTIQSSDYNQLQRCSQGMRGSNVTYSKRPAKACSVDYAQYPRYQLLQEKRDEYSVEIRSQKREELLCKKRNRNLDVDYECYFKLQPEPIPDNLIKTNPSYLDIIKQQTFEGSWDTSDQGLLKTVLVDNTQFSPPQQIKDMNLALADTIWITILVLRWLELACKEDRKAWMLVYQKGCEWLKDHGIDYEEVKGIAESSIRV